MAILISIVPVLLITVLAALPPATDPPVYITEELWRHGEDDDEIIFGSIATVTADAEGRIYILDNQLTTVHLFNPDGELIQSFDREGDGPGELRHPVDMCLLGSRVMALAQAYPGRLVTFDSNRQPSGDIFLGGDGETDCAEPILQLARAADQLLVIGGICRLAAPKDGGKSGRNSSQELFLDRCDLKGRQLGRYMSQPITIDYAGREMNESDYEMPWDRVALAADGRLYFAPERNRYLIEVFTSDGELRHELTRNYNSLRRSKDQKAEVRRSLESFSRYYKIPPEAINIHSTVPDITALWPRPDGELWVRTSRGDSQWRREGLIRLDLFDAEGAYRHQIDLHCPFDPDHDLLFPLGDDRLLLVQGGKDATLDLKGQTQQNDGDEMLLVRYYRLVEQIR
jgi:6-bladed beta-propeller